MGRPSRVAGVARPTRRRSRGSNWTHVRCVPICDGYSGRAGPVWRLSAPVPAAGDRGQHCLDDDQRVVRWGWRLPVDPVAGFDASADENHGHDAHAADDVSGLICPDGHRQQACSEGVDLMAGVPQSGHLQQDLTADSQDGALRQAQEVEAIGRDVLAEITRTDRETMLGGKGEE